MKNALSEEVSQNRRVKNPPQAEKKKATELQLNECLTWYVRISMKILKLCFELPFAWNEPLCSLQNRISIRGKLTWSNRCTQGMEKFNDVKKIEQC